MCELYNFLKLDITLIVATGVIFDIAFSNNICKLVINMQALIF
jgi:hypothetical protein